MFAFEQLGKASFQRCWPNDQYSIKKSRAFGAVILMAYIFAGYSFDRETGLKFGTKEISLPPKERDLLHFLLRADGKTVSKDDVVRDVWQGGIASDESISRAVYRLRLAMQAAGGPPVVSTVYNGGFRISAAIQQRLRAPGSSVAEWLLSPQVHRVLPMIISGREFAARLSPQDISSALRAANAAATADPGYVPAWIAIAEFHVLQAIRSALAPRLAGQLAWAAAQRALELNGACGPALAICGWVRAMIEGDLRGGLTQLDVALRQDSEYWGTCILRAWVLQALGARDEAVVMAQQAFALNPQSLFVAAALPQYLMYAGQREKAQSCAHDMVECFPNVDGVQEIMSILLCAQGRWEAALTHAQRAADLGAQSPLMHGQLAYVLARLQRVEEVQRALEFMYLPERPVPYTALAVVYWALGDRTQTLQCLRDARAHGVPQFFGLRDDPRLAGLAQDAEFLALWREGLRR